MKQLFKKKKKLSASSLLLAGLFLCIVLSVGCSVVKNTSGKNTTRKNAESENTIEQNSIEKGNSNKISIVCTTFPQYDWVKNILGEEAERFNVTLLLDNGVDMHSYQPAVKDIATAGSSNLFIYVGGESDTWVEDALKEAKNKDLKAINLMETLGNSVKEEEVVEGMQEERESLGHSHEKSSKEKQEQTQKESHENSQEINGQKEAAAHLPFLQEMLPFQTQPLSLHYIQQKRHNTLSHNHLPYIGTENGLQIKSLYTLHSELCSHTAYLMYPVF